MNKKLILGIIALTTIVLLGLVGLQMVWINNAIALRKENFVRSVDKAIEHVIEELEKTETENRINQRFGENSKSSFFSNTLDSLNYLFLQELDSIPWVETMENRNINASGDNVRIEIFMNKNNRIVKRMIKIDELPKKTKTKDLNYNIYINENIPKDDIKNLNAQFREFVEKTYKIQDVFNDLFSLSAKQVIEKRISIDNLDSILLSEFSRKDLDTNYQFAIYCSDRQEIVMEKKVENMQKLLDKGFSHKLFPGDTFTSPDYLIVYFPKQKAFLFKQMTNMITISGIIILLILLVFIFTIQTIIKQEKLAEMKNDFINNMTHEFKTPISTISLACEALNDKTLKNSTELQESYIGIIGEENKRLGELAEKILQTAIIEKGELQLKFEDIDINNVIADAIAINKMQIEIKDGIISTDLQAKNHIISADYDHLVNVISNLLDNANKYSPKKPTILISTRNTFQHIEISIKDRGVGISKIDKKKIFEKLYRVPTGDIHNVKGFGLGLSYVKFILDKHFGTIMVDSEINQGSTFTIILPLKHES